MKLTNKLDLPKPFVDAVSSEYTYTPKRYSVTSILKGTRETILVRRHADEIEQDVADMVWMIFGTAVHGVLEQSEESDTQLKENWVSATLPNGYELSGIFDLYDDATGEVTDYKTGSIWKVTFNDWKDYRTQTLAYCWILRQMGFNAHRGKIVMFLKDHSKTKAEHTADYPPYPVHVEQWDFSDDELTGFGNWAALKFDEIKRCEQLPDDELPICTPEERWAKPDKWAVKKKGNKKAQKLFDNEDDAMSYAELQATDSNYQFEVEYRPGEDTKCLNYCPAKAFCSHYKELIGE